MSKKNKLSTRRKQHAFNIEREKAMKKERDEKLEKKKEKMKNKMKGVIVKKKNKRGIKLKKNAVVKGIKIKNAETKRKAKQRLMAEAALKMELD
mmetsp:Transcript_8314/g.21447  ORF Transcript_8314/g.21447 Transcript_8314/m.21447 type:complete len:94 (-) Transcript_8314:944-1225(-)|eukprot:CAMPEP_0198241772 /NCGR_PEP_ID=MMETSP1446-20131203/6487_1 /TAXON_ID=1461542 ORGANISM="Unidentified sp, Strain CCMP2111" /NCGR_SAMPLE_ID=MMETSP1446 /ASSEMBLY_ACC=CAM_ASM_001112 /LENGTH=93 /DNA_ID=CAMNT_0043924649 /DNA_START=208 /DNA_END=489 /DNA_ORIENTATION=-